MRLLGPHSYWSWHSNVDFVRYAWVSYIPNSLQCQGLALSLLADDPALLIPVAVHSRATACSRRLPRPLLLRAQGTLMVNQFESYDPPFLTSTVLQTYDFKSVDKWRYTGYQSLFFIFFFGLAMLIMSVKRYQKR